MRAWSLAVGLIVLANVAAAGEPFGPDEYLRILSDSKLRYNILGQPVKTPVEVRSCPNRDESMRVVQRGGEKKLVPWPMSLDVSRLLADGEKSFQAGKYLEAAVKYAAALEKDPESAAGHLFYGDALLLGGKDPEAALAEYQKAIALDPTLPMAHFFASTAYVQLERKADAREEIIRALTFRPSYEAVWKVARQNPKTWGIRPVTLHRFEPPKGYLGVKGANGIDVFGGANGEWLGYAICKAVWANEDQFRTRHTDGGWAVEEEHACVLNQLTSVLNATEAKLRKQAAGPIDEKDVIATLPPLEAHIFEAANAKLLDGFILFEIVGRNCPIALCLMNDAAKQQIEAYIRRYVIVAAE